MSSTSKSNISGKLRICPRPGMVRVNSVTRQERWTTVSRRDSAAQLARALNGRKVGSGWMAPCPGHDDRTPSLSIKDHGGFVLFHCHAGCSQARVMEALSARGLWTLQTHPHDNVVVVKNLTAQNSDERGRKQGALRIWASSNPATGTLVESYLHSRGITRAVPPSLRFSPALRHPVGGLWPAMVALLQTQNGEPIAIHRTFLDRDGSGKAPIEPNKLMLGSCRGGAVRLAPVTERLLIGEGIETCMSVSQATGQPTWAALSTAGLRTLILPVEVRQIIILADGDDAGEAAAQDAAQRWTSEGRRVRIARPPQGLDFNDILQEAEDDCR
jgi:hypothetical protein